eukprot:scaffold3542_cov54-Phaeocystis_antarctica.AAC.4
MPTAAAQAHVRRRGHCGRHHAGRLRRDLFHVHGLGRLLQPVRVRALRARNAACIAAATAAAVAAVATACRVLGLPPPPLPSGGSSSDISRAAIAASSAVAGLLLVLVVGGVWYRAKKHEASSKSLPLEGGVRSGACGAHHRVKAEICRVSRYFLGGYLRLLDCGTVGQCRTSVTRWVLSVSLQATLR